MNQQHAVPTLFALAASLQLSSLPEASLGAAGAGTMIAEKSQIALRKATPAAELPSGRLAERSTLLRTEESPK